MSWKHINMPISKDEISYRPHLLLRDEKPLSDFLNLAIPAGGCPRLHSTKYQRSVKRIKN